MKVIRQAHVKEEEKKKRNVRNRMPLKTVSIYGDNQGAIFNASNPVQEEWNTLIFNITTLENVYKMERLNYITSRELTILPTYLPKTLDPLSSPNSEANLV
jgi:hypothetical protein